LLPALHRQLLIMYCTRKYWQHGSPNNALNNNINGIPVFYLLNVGENKYFPLPCIKFFGPKEIQNGYKCLWISVNKYLIKNSRDGV